MKGTRASSAFRRRCQTLCVDLWSLKSICLRVPDRCIFFAMISPVSQADNGSFYREGHGSLISTHGPRSLYLYNRPCTSHFLQTFIFATQRIQQVMRVLKSSFRLLNGSIGRIAPPGDLLFARELVLGFIANGFLTN